MTKIRTIFFGTPDFAASALEALLSNPRFEVVGVVTQPDRPTGRKQIITSPPVKAIAEQHGLKVLQPEKLKEQVVQDEILSAKAELAVVVAYGNLIPKRLLESVPRGFVNIHPSLLPKHRGAAPITATILSGDEEAGVCLMVLDELMDHGPIIACRKIALDGTETSESLRAKLKPIAAEMLNTELPQFLDGKLAPRSQNHEEATFCKQLESSDAKIDWSKKAAEIDRLVRAMHGVTPAWTILPSSLRGVSEANDAAILKGQTLLIHHAQRGQSPFPVDKGAVFVRPGTILGINKKMAVACADGSLILDEIQLAGGKPMSGQAFLNGHKDAASRILN